MSGKVEWSRFIMFMLLCFSACCSSWRGGDARCDGAGAQAAGSPEGHQEHGACATSLVLQEEVPAGQERHRETSVWAARVHQENRHPGDERSPAGEGAIWVHLQKLTKICSSTIVFNIDNNQKCFSSSILEWFLKDHVTLKTGVMMLKIQLWSQK